MTPTAMRSQFHPTSSSRIISRYCYLPINVFICLLLLSACSSAPTKQEIDYATNKAAYLTIPSIWTIQAKLGIKSEDNSGSVTLNWQQKGDHYDIQISGPLGQGNAKLSGNNQAIRIVQPGKDTIYSNNPRGLIQQTFGWDLPLQHLPYWIRGVQNPHNEANTDNNQAKQKTAASTQYNEQGLLSGLSQFGWALEYSRYKPQQQRFAPHKIRAKKNDMTLTLIIRQWDFPSPQAQSQVSLHLTY
jgi:outer membrane lipoprotein LolB